MEAIDLTRRNQRYGLLILTIPYPAIWLIGLANSLSFHLPTGAVAIAFPAWLVSAAGAFAVIRRARAGRVPSRIQRYAIYTALGWLVPCCVIAMMAVSAFESLWHALAILTLPAPVFLFLRVGRERFLVCAAVCVSLAWLMLLASSEAPLSFNTRLLIPLALTAGPFWSLAAYAALYEHVLHCRTSEPDEKHEIAVAFVVSALGILLFFGLALGFVILAVSSMR
jgi:hypothetical protein